ncbi:MAG TPA: hypothetical protein QF646_00035, partial [Candidatus Poseidoniales archaeon]|nr:hypothetical protein [Candidatus Poseidoniales archaeon]
MPTGTVEESFEVTAGDSNQVIELEASTDSEIIHAGATLRRIEDVDAVEGDKFMTDVREVDQSTFSPSGERLSQDFAGEITLTNPSQRDRLWDIDLFIDQVSMTSLEGDDEGSHHMALQELKAGDDHNISYTANCPSVLTISEVLDTHPEVSQEPVQVIDARTESTACTLTLTISNQHSLSASDIMVQRTIPKEFTLESPSEEGARIKEHRLTWNVEGLDPGKSATLALSGSVATSFVEPVPTGQVTMEYKVSTPISGMAVSELDAFCRGFGVMNIDQADTPNEWSCQVRFQNKSTFAIDLTSLRVSNQEDESVLFEIDDIGEDVLPDGTWLSETKPVSSVQQPRFNQDLNYTALPRLATGSSGHASMDQDAITVLDGKLSKAFEHPILRSFVQEENSATLTFRNIGSATIERIEIFDDVPGLFQTPNTAAARVTIAGDDLPSDRWQVQVSDGQQIEQEALTIGHAGCHLHFSIGSATPIELQPGQSMLVTYPLMSADPDKENPMIPAPSRIEFGESVHGPTCSRANFDTPMLEVRHERRKFTTGKEIFPAGPPGSYEVFLMYQNRSENALRELVVSDICPPDFEVTSERLTSSLHGDLEVASTRSTTPDGTLLEWKLERMDPEEQVDVIYEIQGDPDVEFKASEVQTVIGADAGEFVETIGEEEVAEDDLVASPTDSPDETDDDSTDATADAEEV